MKTEYINAHKGIRIGALLLALLLVFTIVPYMPVAFAEEAEEAAAQDAEDRRIIVSLGDSYSSGEGIEPFYGQQLPDKDKVQCDDWLAHRSTASWPGRLTLPGVEGTMADNRDTEHPNWYFAAVSGATTYNMLHEKSKDYNVGFYSDSKPLSPQLDVFAQLGDDKADYVTLTLGGNDAGFTDIIKTAATSIYYFSPSKLSDQLNQTWNHFYEEGGIRDDLRKAYNDIADRAGEQATIIVAGYPQLLDPAGDGMFFDNMEASLINSSVSRFNSEIQNIVIECQNAGMRICFVSVEDAFLHHAAYASDPYINEVILFSKMQDIDKNAIVSAYSVHPNSKGAARYAECVQAMIDYLEENPIVPPVRTTSQERDIVLVLDTSGSMDGQPIEQTRLAASNFIDTILGEDASIGIVTYDFEAHMASDFLIQPQPLQNVANGILAGGGTNTEAGLAMAHDMLQNSTAKKRIILLMSDGEPNIGKCGDELVSYVDSLRDEGIIVYTLGFFENMSSGKSSAQTLMEQLASEGRHYEVDDASDLVFTFEDMAEQINGQRYVYVRIACPVDVQVTYDGQTLSSAEADRNTRTDFGVLSFEESETSYRNGEDDLTKVLRLKEGPAYTLRITGTGRGLMDYTIGFMDENGDYSDFRHFENIKITPDTVIEAAVSVADVSTLQVDEDGDGRYELTYRAGINETVAQGSRAAGLFGWIATLAAGAVALLVIVLLLIRKSSKSSSAAPTVKFCVVCGGPIPAGAKTCSKCGTPIKKMMARVRLSREEQTRRRKTRVKLALVLIAILLAAAIAITLTVSFTGYRGLVRKVMHAYETYDIDALLALSSDMYYYDNPQRAQQYFERAVDYTQGRVENELGANYKLSYQIAEVYAPSGRRTAELLEEIQNSYPDFDSGHIGKLTIVQLHVTARHGGAALQFDLQLTLAKEDGVWKLLYMDA